VDARKVARFRINYELLRQFLLLPSSARIIKVGELPQDRPGSCWIYVESPDFPPIDEGQPMPELTPIHQEAKAARLVDWGMP